MSPKPSTTKSFLWFPSGKDAANHLPQAILLILCILFSYQLNFMLLFLHASSLLVPTSASFYPDIHCPSSEHIQTISVWPLWLYPQNIWSDNNISLIIGVTDHNNECAVFEHGVEAQTAETCAVCFWQMWFN